MFRQNGSLGHNCPSRIHSGKKGVGCIGHPGCSNNSKISVARLAGANVHFAPKSVSGGGPVAAAASGVSEGHAVIRAQGKEQEAELRHNPW